VTDAVASRRRQWRQYWLYDPLLGSVNVSLQWLQRHLPIDWTSSFGGFCGRLIGRTRYTTLRVRLGRSWTLLSASSEEAAGAAIDRWFDNAGRTMSEFAVLHRLWAANRITVVGDMHWRAAGTPMIFAGLHLGNWEVIGPALIGLGVERLRLIYQPPQNRFDHRIVVAARERYGISLLKPSLTATRTALRHLVDDRGPLLIYIDDERDGTVVAPLFGRAIPTRMNIANVVRFSWASGAAIVPVFAERLTGAHFRVTFLPPVELAAKSEDPSALAENIRRIDTVMTPLIRARIDQWYMLPHLGLETLRRWSTAHEQHVRDHPR
jgi:KDO2-lipid IV(A) lauroyltransferase